MNIIIPGMDMDSADKRATCARCNCVYEFLPDEAKFYRSVVDFCNDDTKKSLTSFSIGHMVVECPNCRWINLVEDRFSVSYNDVINTILKDIYYSRAESEHLSTDEPVGNPDKLKQDRQKDLIDNVLIPFAGWIFGFCEDCNDADACKDCQLSDLCQRGLYPSKIADAINEIANDFKPVEIDQFKISIDK